MKPVTRRTLRVAELDHVPLADLPRAHDAAEDERVLAHELLGGLAGGEDAHRPLRLRIAEGADGDQRPARVEVVEARAVGGVMRRRPRGDVVGRRVEEDVPRRHQAVTAAANAASVVCQAPGWSNCSRIRSASGPNASRSRCSSSTRVRSGASSTKRTSIVVLRSTWYFQSAPICHVTTNRLPGSHSTTWPVEVSLPSMWRVYHRPPSWGSMTISLIGALPMWWSLGHHDVICAVNTSKARADDTGTTT